MANLKIFTANNPANPPGRAGYIAVAEEIIRPANYLEFLEADPGERADLLNGYAGTGAPAATAPYVQHETTAGVSEKIDNTNCRVMVEIDVRKTKKKSKHTMSFPTNIPANLNYLQPYVNEIVAIHNGAGGANPADAKKFLFGVMLLTKCR